MSLNKETKPYIKMAQAFCEIDYQQWTAKVAYRWYWKQIISKNPSLYKNSRRFQV